jgi:MFS family permease
VQPLAQLSNMALLPSLGALRADMGLSYLELGWIVAAFGLARLAVDLPAGSLAARWNPRTILMVAFAVSAVASALGVFAISGWQVGAVRLLIGMGSSVAQAMLLAWLVGGTGRAARGRVMARGEVFFSIAGLIVPTIAGLLAGPLGWRAAFVLGAVAAAGGLIIILLLTRSRSAALAVGLETGPRHTGAQAPPPWSELRVGGPLLLSAYLVTFVVFFSRNGLLNAVVPVLGVERLGFDALQIGLLFSTINAIGIGAVLLSGRLADRHGRAGLLVPGLVLLLASQVLLLGVVDQRSYVLVGVFQGLAFFINPVPAIVLGDALPPRLRPRGIAVYRAVCDSAILCAPVLMGVSLELGGFRAAEVVTAGATLLVLAAVWLLLRRRRVAYEEPDLAAA